MKEVGYCSEYLQKEAEDEKGLSVLYGKYLELSEHLKTRKEALIKYVNENFDELQMKLTDSKDKEEARLTKKYKASMQAVKNSKHVCQAQHSLLQTGSRHDILDLRDRLNSW